MATAASTASPAPTAPSPAPPSPANPPPESSPSDRKHSRQSPAPPRSGTWTAPRGPRSAQSAQSCNSKSLGDKSSLPRASPGRSASSSSAPTQYRPQNSYAASRAPPPARDRPQTHVCQNEPETPPPPGTRSPSPCSPESGTRNKPPSSHNPQSARAAPPPCRRHDSPSPAQ